MQYFHFFFSFLILKYRYTQLSLNGFTALIPSEPHVANHNPGLMDCCYYLFCTVLACTRGFILTGILLRITSSKMPWSMRPSPKMLR